MDHGSEYSGLVHVTVYAVIVLAVVASAYALYCFGSKLKINIGIEDHGFRVGKVKLKPIDEIVLADFFVRNDYADTLAKMQANCTLAVTPSYGAMHCVAVGNNYDDATQKVKTVITGLTGEKGEPHVLFAESRCLV
jgi:hypothetical protein